MTQNEVRHDGFAGGSQGRARHHIVNVGLFLGVVFACLLIAEGVVRTFMGDTIVLFPRYHTSATYGDFTIRVLRPHSVFKHTSVDGSWKFAINENGFRNDRNFGYQKAPGVVRVLSIGDSHTEGFEVRQDHTFSAVLERYLESQGIDAEVINAGVSGFGTAEELVFLANEGMRYDPDFIVLGFFRNDFDDNIKSNLYALDDGELVIANRVHTPAVRVLDLLNGIGPLRWLSENSYLYSLAMNTVWERGKRLLLGRREAALATEYAVGSGSLDALKTQLGVRLIEDLHATAKGGGSELIILDVPQIDPVREFSSSVPAGLEEAFERHSDRYFHSETVLDAYRDGTTEFHVPHGHRHISEFTHRILGTQTGRYIAEVLARRADAAEAASDPGN